MKPVERIFLFIFFVGMFTTVINYMPVIEEEVSSQSHSSSQTQKGKDSDGSEPLPDDETSPGKDLFHAPGVWELAYTEVPDVNLRAVSDRYFPTLPDDCTPPPRLLS